MLLLCFQQMSQSLTNYQEVILITNSFGTNDYSETKMRIAHEF
jgi:hypothetical protein